MRRHLNGDGDEGEERRQLQAHQPAVALAQVPPQITDFLVRLAAQLADVLANVMEACVDLGGEVVEPAIRPARARVHPAIVDVLA